ncbi:hypothetical protein Holit_00847 [Hollandina sp. SP2]
MSNEEQFIAYEYKNVTAARGLESIYLDSFPSFGWELDGIISPVDKSMPVSRPGGAAVSLKFKRHRKIKNKAALARLERQFEDSLQVIEGLEKSKTSVAGIAAFTIGIIGAAFMAGSVFAYMAGMLPLMVILAIPGFFGWIFPYFCYTGVKAKQVQKASPLIDKQFDAVYEVCEKAHALLAG